MRRALISITGLVGLFGAGPAAAQSMNIARIVHAAMTEVCGPFLQSGDRAAAAQAAMAGGYRPVGGVEGASSGSTVHLDGSLRHRGWITLIDSRDQICSVDMAEAGVVQISDLAAEHLTALGMARIWSHGDETLGVIVWAGEGRQAVIAPSNLSTGAAITLSWVRPDQSDRTNAGTASVAGP